jgi:hypothetical protein
VPWPSLEKVLDAVRALADLIAQTRTILEAIRDGRAYLARNHPEAREDLAHLLEQMHITLAGLISVTRVVTDFSFTIDGSERDRQPDRFNDRLMDARAETGKLEADIWRLKDSCQKVEDLTKALNRRARNSPWWALLGDRAGQMAWDLARDLHELYGTDEEIIERINEMLKASDKALSAVNEALRAGDGSSVHNVDKAAAILREQAEAIRPVEDQLKQLRDELSDQIAKLR